LLEGDLDTDSDPYLFGDLGASQRLRAR
jgi:hypothetical protein